MREHKTVRRMRPYLVINLLLVVALLIGLKIGGTTWDTTIRLPGLLIWLVLINGILVIRAGWLHHHHGRRRDADAPQTIRLLRRQLATPERADADSVTEMLRTVSVSLDDHGALVVLFDQHGNGSELCRYGRVPGPLGRLRWTVRNRRLLAAHAGGLGEEDLGAWPIVVAAMPFRSALLRQAALVVPLGTTGRQCGLWLRWRITGTHTGTADPIANTATPAPLDFTADLPNRRPSEPQALALESALSLHLLEQTLSTGTPFDPRTGLLRAETLNEHLDREIERSERYHQPMSVMLLNPKTAAAPTDADTQNRVVAAMAAALRESLRRLDLMAATSTPGVFAAILTEADAQVAERIGQRVQTAFLRHYSGTAPAGSPAPQLFIGFACCPTDATGGPTLLEKATEALHGATRQGDGILAWRHDLSNTQ